MDNKGLKWVCIVLGVAVIILSGTVVYLLLGGKQVENAGSDVIVSDKNDQSDTVDTSYVGLYYVYEKAENGPDGQRALLLNEDGTFYMRLTGTSIEYKRGTYKVDNDKLILNITKDLYQGTILPEHSINETDIYTIIDNNTIDIPNYKNNLVKTEYSKISMYDGNSLKDEYEKFLTELEEIAWEEITRGEA